ncbi:hypothetical protein [Streptomyces sp. CC224B]|uniref:hypothetical protein n=1 Tax=Streptomyces sp. CC224B TaxID=3044571 RepID=UPI0024A94BDA|nr:hypothetical protein [Streptomyces sp. CC224B]
MFQPPQQPQPSWPLQSSQSSQSSQPIESRCPARRGPACAPGTPPARPGTGRTVIVVVVLVLGAALASAGLPAVVIAEVLAAAGLVGAHLARQAPLAPDAR